MAIIRRGYSDDFVLKNGNAGIGSADPQTSLDVAGAIKAQSFKSTGTSSFSGYEGFLNSDQQIDESISINGGASLSGEIIVGTGVTATVGSAATGSQGAIESLKVYNTFNPPLGGTNDRPYAAKPGQLYYNQDFKTIEFWDGNNWRQVDYTTQRGRGILGNGQSGTILDFVQIQTLGNAQRFGDLSVARGTTASGSNSTRGIFAGGTPAGKISYVTIASEGNTSVFGDLTTDLSQAAAAATQTRFTYFGGRGSASPNPNLSQISYVNIATLGDHQEFGELSIPNRLQAGFSDSHGGLGGF